MWTAQTVSKVQTERREGCLKQCKSSAWKRSRQLNVTSDPLECSPLRSNHKHRDMDAGNFGKFGESGKETPNYVLEVAECLVYL